MITRLRSTNLAGGALSGTSISTVGYRGMHSYQLFFDQYLVPHSHVIGESQGLGRGFYFTMRGFTGGRIQTAARACGLMQGAFEARAALCSRPQSIRQSHRALPIVSG